MVKQMIHLEGQRFGRLVVISQHPERYKGNSIQWICKCDCGNETIIVGYSLRRGHTTSCGCFLRESSSKRNWVHGYESKFGDTRLLHMAWRRMIRRCHDSTCSDFKDYGARGIQVCERWHDFANFLEDMGNRPTPKHTVERKDNNKGYCKENCKWATRLEQSRNTRNCVLTKELVDKIKELSYSGLSSLKIAKLVPVSSSHIRKVINGTIRRDWNE